MPMTLDEALARIAALEREVARLQEPIVAFLDKWPDVEQRIIGLFQLQFARSGVQYDGPNIGAEVEAMRAALKLAGKARAGAVCEVVRGEHPNPLLRICDRPAVWRYPAQGGGWMYLCAQHGEHHRGSMRGWLEQWTATGWQLEHPKAGATP